MSPDTVVVTLNDALPNWGEGADENEARANLLANVIERHKMLSEDRDRLASGLLAEVRFMDDLLGALRCEA